MRRLFISLLLLILPAFSQTKHPFTFEDMMKLKRVGEPAPSPDGKWVLFSAVDVDLATNKKTPQIWIVPLEGGSQVWIADFDGTGGNVTGVFQLTSIATEAGGELWSPDGKRVLFTSDIY